MVEKGGFSITQTNPEFTDIYAQATVSQIEDCLGVRMNVVTYHGRTAPSAVTPPRLPREIGNDVVAIGGLQPVIQAVKHVVPRESQTRGSNRDGSPVPRPAAVQAPTYKVADILNAYGATKLGITGKGQVIAILIDKLPSQNDIAEFIKRNQLVANINQVSFHIVQGIAASSLLPDGEETLDTEWALGIAPGAKVRVYASGSLEYTYLDRALNQILSDVQSIPGLRQVSISLGLREDLVSAGEKQIEHLNFLKLQALGVTVFVSSGDAGSNPDASGHERGNDSVVEYEASDPSTAAVGGTTMILNRATGKVTREIGWRDSGGGVSRDFNRPSWQGTVGSRYPAKRLVPDVSAVADSTPGAFVWLNGKEWPVGGTSWSTPIWAGFTALIAESRHNKGQEPLGFLPNRIYKIPGARGFRDITAGSNGAYSATIGWDAVTGLGVPNIKELIASLP